MQTKSRIKQTPCLISAPHPTPATPNPPTPPSRLEKAELQQQLLLLQNLSRHFLLHNQNTLTHKRREGGMADRSVGGGWGGQGVDYLTLYQPLPPTSRTTPSSLPAPPSYGCALPLTAGSDYGCEKWGSHANNPPLQHSCSMTAHFLPALLLARSLASLPAPTPPFLLLSPSLCLSSAV